MKRTSLLSLIVLAAGFARADIVTLADGTTIEGDVVSENDTEIVLKGSFGKTTIKRSDIRELKRKPSPAAELRNKMALVAAGPQKNDAEAWYALSQEGRQAGANEEVQRALEKVIAINPNHAKAREELGYVRENDKWVVKKQAAQAPSRTPSMKDAQPAQPMTKEKLGALSGLQNFSEKDEKPVECPRCKGSGVYIYLDCSSCKRSDRPGYQFFGDKGYEVCAKCKGSAKIIGAVCLLCNQTGKVMPSHIKPLDGGQKKPPAGYNWCSTCNATCYEDWSPCSQCKRSKWPGYLFTGDTLQICNRCGGNGKIPSIPCRTCGAKGIVPIQK